MNMQIGIQLNIYLWKDNNENYHVLDDREKYHVMRM